MARASADGARSPLEAAPAGIAERAAIAALLCLAALVHAGHVPLSAYHIDQAEILGFAQGLARAPRRASADARDRRRLRPPPRPRAPPSSPAAARRARRRRDGRDRRLLRAMAGGAAAHGRRRPAPAPRLAGRQPPRRRRGAVP